MGIHCEINLYKPSDGAYKPGSHVNGAIKYSVDEETMFKNITVSLRGRGKLYITNKYRKSDGDRYRTTKYVDVDNVLVDEQTEQTISVGSYEIPFSFALPTNIPPSVKFSKSSSDHDVNCKIFYYIRIKFVRTGFLKLNKYFKKEVEVIAGITPIILPAGQCILGEKKTLTQLFKRDKSNVEIKATIQRCAIQPGEKINITYELTNDTDVTIEKVKWKLVEIYNFFISDGSPSTVVRKAVEGTDAKTGSVTSGNKQSMDIEISVPSDIEGSIDSSKIFSREYEVKLVVRMPMLHRDVKLPIPIQIGALVQEMPDTSMPMNRSEPPPSYWEAMAEYDEKSGDDL